MAEIQRPVKLITEIRRDVIFCELALEELRYFL
jgi:hypothetical protein